MQACPQGKCKKLSSRVLDKSYLKHRIRLIAWQILLLNTRYNIAESFTTKIFSLKRQKHTHAHRHTHAHQFSPLTPRLGKSPPKLPKCRWKNLNQRRGTPELQRKRYPYRSESKNTFPRPHCQSYHRNPPRWWKRDKKSWFPVTFQSPRNAIPGKPRSCLCNRGVWNRSTQRRSYSIRASICPITASLRISSQTQTTNRHPFQRCIQRNTKSATKFSRSEHLFSLPRIWTIRDSRDREAPSKPTNRLHQYHHLQKRPSY